MTKHLGFPGITATLALSVTFGQAHAPQKSVRAAPIAKITFQSSAP